MTQAGKTLFCLFVEKTGDTPHVSVLKLLFFISNK